MAYGPMQMIVIGLGTNDRFDGRILDELRRLRNAGLIRMVDLLFVRKDEDGEITGFESTDYRPTERAEFGAMIGGLLGLGAAGPEETIARAELGALATSRDDHGADREEIRQIAEDLPKGASAAILLVEHTWALRIKELAQNAGGKMLAQTMVSPQALIAAGVEIAEAAGTESATDGRKSAEAPKPRRQQAA